MSQVVHRASKKSAHVLNIAIKANNDETRQRQLVCRIFSWSEGFGYFKI